MIQVERLTKTFGRVVAVKDASFTVGEREVVGVLGPNGAGKTTLLRVIAGFLGATSGTVRVAGFDVARAPLETRARLGYLPETTPLYPELRVREYLHFRAELKGVPRRDRQKAVERALEDSGATAVKERLISELSKGYRQRVGLADALVARPPLLILDEPTSGLDPNQIREVRELIRGLGQAHTVLLSTHILSEVEAACDRAIVIHRGTIAAEGTLPELRAQASARGVELGLRGARADIETVLAGLPDALSRAIATKRLEPEASERAQGSDGDPKRLAIELAPGEDPGLVIEALLPLLCRAGLRVHHAAPVRATLEDVFAEVTGAREPGLDAAASADPLATSEEP